MNKEMVAKIKANGEYQKLVKTKNSFAVVLSIIMLLVYVIFILAIAFEPHMLATPIYNGSVVSVGIIVGVSVIVFAIGITGVYTYRANREFDELASSVKSKIGEMQ